MAKKGSFLILSLSVASFCLLLSPVAHGDTLMGNMPTSYTNFGGVSNTQFRAVSFTTASSAFQISSVSLVLEDFLPQDGELAYLSFQLASLTETVTEVPSGTVYAPTNTPIATLVAPAGGGTSGVAAYEFTVPALTTITLAANTTYWLVIQASAPSGENTATFAWARSNPATTPVSDPSGLATFGIQAISQDAGAVWEYGDSGAHSFTIQGSVVPEPAVLSLLPLALLALWLFRRRAASPQPSL